MSTLSERERRELEKLEQALATEDPKLAQRMRSARPPRRPARSARPARPARQGSWWSRLVATMEARWERRMREAGRF